MALLATTAWFYTSHDPDRGWIWVYGVFASYPSSVLVRFLRLGGLRLGSEPVLAATLLLVGTLQWGVIGAAIDAIIHRTGRGATPNI